MRMSRAVAGAEADLRFDDMLTTLLAQPEDSDDARVALWRQLVDLLAQDRFSEDDMLSERALDIIAYLRITVPSGIRYETARAFIGRSVSPATIALFADEPASVISPLIAAAQFSAEQWLSLLPTLTPTARALLRHRRDLPKEVIRALESFGPSDLVFPGMPDRAANDKDPEVVEDFGGEEEPTFEVIPPADEPVVEEAEPFQLVAEEVETEDSEFQFAFEELEKVAETIPTPDAPSLAANMDGGEQIRDLMARIEAYQSHDFVRPADAPQIDDDRFAQEMNDKGFRFETASDGVIKWVAGASRGPLIGETIAIASSDKGHGVDASVAGAFRQRAPFRDARLTLSGDGQLAGEWRISAVPLFDQVDGRFSGYRGTARRPRVDEVATPVPGAGGFVSGDAESLRQLVHELRTPLNAIIGFSEMIEGQFLGPASTGYRAKATDIISQGKRLLEALEDLDLTARLDPNAKSKESIDPAQLLERLHNEYQDMADERGFHLKLRITTGLGLVAADPVAVERMFGRLLAATLAIAQRGETVAINLAHDPDSRDRMNLEIARPAMLEGRDERTLLDPGYNPDGDWPDAPVLGLGFALRLVRNIAAACGGALDIQPEMLILRLPLRKISARTGKG
jgi:signal transduction histidine kinase